MLLDSATRSPMLVNKLYTFSMIDLSIVDESKRMVFSVLHLLYTATYHQKNINNPTLSKPLPVYRRHNVGRLDREDCRY